MIKNEKAIDYACSFAAIIGYAITGSEHWLIIGFGCLTQAEIRRAVEELSAK